MSCKLLGEALFRLKSCALFCHCVFGNAKATLKFDPPVVVKKIDSWVCLNTCSSKVFNDSMTVDVVDVAKHHNPVSNTFHQFCGKVCLCTEPGDESAHGCVANEDEHNIFVVKEKKSFSVHDRMERLEGRRKKAR